MPKKSKKGPVSSLGDVSIHDYANSAAPKNRVKKSSTNVNIALKKAVEKAWDEKTESDFENELDPEQDDDETASCVFQKCISRTKKSSVSKSSKYHLDNESRKSYPIDIWFILSEYIKPEDVGIFAAICRSSYEVTCSAKFWFSLYRRYYKYVPDMPTSLQPERLIRKLALRQNVIRSLFYMYQPFRNRKIENHPSVLIDHKICEISTKETIKGEYTYYFKMKPKTLASTYSGTTKTPILWDILDDIFYNPDEHCCALKVVCHQLKPIPLVTGLTLRSTSLTLSSVRAHKLQLDFGPMYGGPGGADFTTVILDPVVKVLVVDWWHHLYPFNRNHMLDLSNRLNCLY